MKHIITVITIIILQLTLCNNAIAYPPPPPGGHMHPPHYPPPPPHFHGWHMPPPPPHGGCYNCGGDLGVIMPAIPGILYGVSSVINAVNASRPVRTIVVPAPTPAPQIAPQINNYYYNR